MTTVRQWKCGQCAKWVDVQFMTHVHRSIAPLPCVGVEHPETIGGVAKIEVTHHGRTHADPVRELIPWMLDAPDCTRCDGLGKHYASDRSSIACITCGGSGKDLSAA